MITVLISAAAIVVSVLSWLDVRSRTGGKR